MLSTISDGDTVDDDCMRGPIAAMKKFMTLLF